MSPSKSVKTLKGPKISGPLGNLEGEKSTAGIEGGLYKDNGDLPRRAHRKGGEGRVLVKGGSRLTSSRVTLRAPSCQWESDLEPTMKRSTGNHKRPKNGTLTVEGVNPGNRENRPHTGAPALA